MVQGTFYTAEQTSKMARYYNNIKAHKIFDISKDGFIIPLPQGYPQKTTEIKMRDFEVLKGELKVGEYLDIILFPQSYNSRILSYG